MALCLSVLQVLHKKDFKPPDKVPRNYDQQPFRLDGQIDLDIKFHDKSINTPVFVKMDAKKQLLLSEGFAGVKTYHPDVEPRKALKLPGGHQSAPQYSACVAIHSEVQACAKHAFTPELERGN